MLPENPTTTSFSFDDFTARKSARQTADDLPAQLAESIVRVKAATPKRKPAAEPATLADVLRQAVGLAMARRGRETRDVLVREQVLLELLTDAMRREA